MPGLTRKLQPNAYFKTWQVTAIVLAGTIVRFGYGFTTKAWLGSPDQLAWGLDIDEMLHSKNWNYIQLTHAPHEGASFFISLFSILFRPFQSLLPSLSLAALVIDSVGRFIQIRIAQKLFGDETALWFALWSILAVPVLIPWGTVNFGLHALLSFVPFVFCWIMQKYKGAVSLPWICGIACGIAVSLSYNSIVLVVTAALFFVFDGSDPKRKIKNLLVFFVVSGITFLPHLLARIYNDPPDEAMFSIRGAPFHFIDWQPVINLYSVWFTSLPGSLLLLPGRILCGSVFLFLLVGMTFYITTAKNKINYLPVLILFVFIVLYAFSPFYGKEYGNPNYVYYRHLCYIVPLLVVMVINGFIKMGSVKRIVLAGWLLFCGTATAYYIFNPGKPTPTYKAAGWILAKKYQSDIGKLFAISSLAPAMHREELIKGFGWGLGASVLQRNDPAAVEKLVALIRNAPQGLQHTLEEGVRYAFTKGVTPVLNPSLLPEIDARLAIKNAKHL
jgi:hypothetical protein